MTYDLNYYDLIISNRFVRTSNCVSICVFTTRVACDMVWPRIIPVHGPRYPAKIIDRGRIPRKTIVKFNLEVKLHSTEMRTVVGILVVVFSEEPRACTAVKVVAERSHFRRQPFSTAAVHFRPFVAARESFLATGAMS